MRRCNLFFMMLLVGCLGSTAQAQVGYGPGSLSPAPLRGMPGMRNQPGRSGIMSGAIIVQPAVVQTLEPVPADAKALLDVFDAEAAAIRAKAEQEIQIRRQTLISALQALQDAYTREAKLDEAVAIRDRIRHLKVGHLKVEPNPGNLSAYVNRIGETFYFAVVGRTDASIWGTEVYTYDSDLATAAVHAGVVKPGKSGIVKVTMIKSPESHHGSTQNGVTSANWGEYSASYTVEPAYRDALPVLKANP